MSSYLRLVLYLESGATVTFLLRSPAVFDADKVIQEYVKSGKARLIKGDALVQEDVKRVWEEAAAGEGEPVVDLLVFTVGALFDLLSTRTSLHSSRWNTEVLCYERLHHYSRQPRHPIPSQYHLHNASVRDASDQDHCHNVHGYQPLVPREPPVPSETIILSFPRTST